MPTVQDTYRDTIRRAVAGMVDSMVTYDAVTRICATAAGIPFGVAVSDSTGRKDAVIGGALTSFLGVSMKDITVPPASDADEIPQYASFSVLRMGVIWVQISTNVARGDAVHYSTTTGIFANAGGIGPVLGARWEAAGTAGDIAPVYLPGYAQQ